MAFKPRSLIGEHCIGCRVGFIKSVLGKLLHQIKEPCRKRLTMAFIECALNKDLPLLGHLFGLFLTHGTPKQVGTS